jgi:hypothetical protein
VGYILKAGCAEHDGTQRNLSIAIQSADVPAALSRLPAAIKAAETAPTVDDEDEDKHRRVCLIGHCLLSIYLLPQKRLVAT